MSAPDPPGWAPLPAPAATLAPWDEAWVKIHKLSRPMFITLYDAGQQGARRVRRGHVTTGQWRLIRNGLYRRYLIDEWQELTMAGLVLSVWAAVAVERAYPARPDEVRTR